MVKTKKVQDSAILLNFKKIIWAGIWTTMVVLLWSLCLNNFVFKLPKDTTSTTDETINAKNDGDKYVIFQDSKIFLGERLYLVRPVQANLIHTNRVTKRNDTFLLIGVDKDFVTVRTEDGKENIVKNLTCLPVLQNGEEIATDVFYKYCFSISVQGSVLNINYKLRTDGWKGGLK